MRYYIIAGEASGDLHASNLVKELKLIQPSAKFRAWGGDLLKAEGVEIVKHIRELAFMGFTEVIMNLRTIFKNIDLCKKDILAWKPDAVILVDYPGFNLRIAEFLHSNGIKVLYYISPQVWAWKQSRVHKIKRSVDKMFVILPFEKKFYNGFGMEVEYVGHPLLDAIRQFETDLPDGRTFRQMNGFGTKPLIALLPGSRKQEINTMLPLMVETAGHFTDYQFVIAGAPSIPGEFYEQITRGKIPLLHGQTYAILKNAHAALVTSGTATLETALFGVPEVVCYKGGTISYLIARKLVKVRFISLVNLIMDREVVKELIQSSLSPKNLIAELERVLDGETRDKMITDLNLLRDQLGGEGASGRTAKLIASYMNSGDA